MAQTTTARRSSGQEQGSAGERVEGAARGAAESATSELGGMKERAGGKVRQALDQRSSELGSQVTSAAGAIRQAGEQLREQGSGGAATVVEAVAERADRLGGYMREHGADRMLGDAEELARRRPWLVAGAAATAGFLASRLLKASSRSRYRSAGTGMQGRAAGGPEPAESYGYAAGPAAPAAQGGAPGGPAR